jgi:hypothetical protein
MWSALGEMLGDAAIDNGTKGCLVEKAFVFGLENNHDALPISAAVCNTTPPKVIFTVPGNAHVIRFSGVTPSSTNRDTPAVFVPNSPSSYGVDFVVWLPTHPETRLWLLQLTVAPVQQRGTLFFDAKPGFLVAWRELLGVTVDDPIGRVWGCMEIPPTMFSRRFFFAHLKFGFAFRLSRIAATKAHSTGQDESGRERCCPGLLKIFWVFVRTMSIIKLKKHMTNYKKNVRTSTTIP